MKLPDNAIERTRMRPLRCTLRPLASQLHVGLLQSRDNQKNPGCFAAFLVTLIGEG